MMQKSYVVDQNNALVQNGVIYDLHNTYDLIGLFVDTPACNLTIFLKPTPKYGIGLKALALKFQDLDYFEFGPLVGNGKIAGIEEIGYKSPSDRDDEWLMTEAQANNNDHIFFRLDGGDFVRVHCERTWVEELDDIPIIGGSPGYKK